MDKQNRDAQDYVRRITAPIFDKVAQEASKNQMVVGSPGFSEKKTALYCPHNFKIFVDINTKGINWEKVKNQGYHPGIVYKSWNNGSEHILEPINGCWVRIKRTQVEIKVLANRWYIVNLDSLESREKQVIDILLEKDAIALDALKEFIQIYGGKSEFKILNRSAEDKVMAEDMVNLLPIKQRWHTDIVKKVYEKKAIEFNDQVFSANYFRNRGLEDFAPEIVQAIMAQNPLRAIKSYMEAEPGERWSWERWLALTPLVKLLSVQEAQEISVWLTRRPGYTTGG